MLFNYTVKENILYGNNNCTDKEILQAAEVANANEFLKEDSKEENKIEDDYPNLYNLYKENEVGLKKILENKL